MQARLAPALITAALVFGTSAAGAQPVQYKTDPMHTFVTFEVLHFGTSTVRGRFDKTEGTITLDRKAGTGEADIRIDTRSMNSGVADFDKHLATADFFDSGKHPEARFVGKDFKFDGDKLASVSGQLTLLGKTQPVTLKAQNFNCYDSPMVKTQVCGGDFETTLKRSQWGMNYGIDFGIPDDVRLTIQIEAVRQ